MELYDTDSNAASRQENIDQLFNKLNDMSYPTAEAKKMAEAIITWADEIEVLFHQTADKVEHPMHKLTVYANIALKMMELAGPMLQGVFEDFAEANPGVKFLAVNEDGVAEVVAVDDPDAPKDTPVT